MESTVLLLGHGKTAGRAMADHLARLGYRPTASTWADFLPRRFGRNRPHVIIADMDKKTAQPMEALVRAVRKVWGQVAIIALIESTKFKDVSAMLDAGAAECLSKTAPAGLLERKLSRCLAVPADTTEELTEEIPLELLAVFQSHSGLVRLDELCTIHTGAAPRHPTWRRLAPPDREWRGALTAAAVERFQAGKPDVYLRWNRLCLFRMPDPAEYAVREKVLLRRAGPPMAAAVDRSRLPAGAGVYSLVPKDGISAGYLACLLNSRLLDFYFNRLAGSAADGHIRPDILRKTPVPVPMPEAAQELNRIAVLLEHFGPSPESWIDRQTRDELLDTMERTIFGLYNADANAVASLEAMCF